MKFSGEEELLKKRLYQTEVHYKKMENLTDDDIEAIKEEAKNCNERLDSENIILVFDRYLELIKEILKTKNTRDFDRNISLIIQTIDPELTTYLLYKEMPITSKKEIEKAEDENTAENLKSRRERELSDYQNEVRKIVGMYDSKLRFYERDYYNKFVKQKTIQK